MKKQFDGGGMTGTYLVINDATAGFAAGADGVVRLQNAAHVQATDFIV